MFASSAYSCPRPFKESISSGRALALALLWHDLSPGLWQPLEANWGATHTPLHLSQLGCHSTYVTVTISLWYYCRLHFFTISSCTGCLVCGQQEVAVIRADKNKHLANAVCHREGHVCTLFSLRIDVVRQSKSGECVSRQIGVSSRGGLWHSDTKAQTLTFPLKPPPLPTPQKTFKKKKKKNQWAVQILNEWCY